MILKRKDRHHGGIGDRLATESGEDYLVCIFELVSTKGYARVADVANSLSVRILSAFLRSLGLPWNVIRKDVYGLEHHLSQKTLECLERLVKGDGLGTDG